MSAAPSSTSGNPHRTFLLASAACGSGKTYATTTFICARIPYGFKGAIIQPTRELAEQTYNDARERYPHLADRIQLILGDPDYNPQSRNWNSVNKQLIDYTVSRNERDGELAILTHAGFQRCDYWHRRDTWHMFVDEAIQVDYFAEILLSFEKQVVLRHVELQPSNYPEYGVLEATSPDGLARLVKKHYRSDVMIDAVKELLWRLADPNWTIYVKRSDFDHFATGEARYLLVHGLLSPSIFDDFGSVTALAANFFETLMHRWFQKCGVEWREHVWICDHLQFREHTDGHRMTIKYLTEHRWSKTYRDKKLTADDGSATTIMEYYTELCSQATAGRQTYWMANLDQPASLLGGERVKNVSHGLNRLQQFDACCVMTAMIPQQPHRYFMRDVLGLTEADINRAIIAQAAYQASGRGVMRNQQVL